MEVQDENIGVHKESVRITKSNPFRIGPFGHRTIGPK